MVLFAACAPVAHQQAPADEGRAQVAAFIEKLTPCPDEADTAALDKLYPILGHIDVKAGYSLDAAEKSIACLRPWAMTLADPCQRNGILHWCDYYEGKIGEARENLAHGIPETSEEKYWREQREKEIKVRTWTDKHPFPKLPQCSDSTVAAR